MESFLAKDPLIHCPRDVVRRRQLAPKRTKIIYYHYLTFIGLLITVIKNLTYIHLLTNYYVHIISLHYITLHYFLTWPK